MEGTKNFKGDTIKYNPKDRDQAKKVLFWAIWEGGLWNDTHFPMAILGGKLRGINDFISGTRGWKVGTSRG